ncbi:mRNA export receptor Nxt1 [Schizosaccharomyces pombe]|uniref:NTF2-related export protein 1 n=1 Tax=Schizosaccharomyces pombe (strain 972 / ATCC 24843) TaxID=284812 RepID=NXT1_SCHPO|nr:mRNA export receptor Nxt1 [Schizosaccharomyces pombe]P0CAN8.1 RecName: Full=NTF2-related export protein 1; AltName: Full=p15 [Schizosaccharomyces pombe 972h-]CAC21476.2 mRNA export receptor Nxt1 [Schizosaccharomyces pombe]|eukprot:NP_593517.2 mRNA export receptor Nxt1 [Schizosaccharomyces pombe]
MESSVKYAQEFVQRYYSSLDTNRNGIAEFYRENSLILWNGKPMQVTEFTSMIVNLPYSKTKVEDFDSQQVMGNDMNIIIVVSGTIRFDGKKPHVFSYVSFYCIYLLVLRSSTNFL